MIALLWPWTTFFSKTSLNSGHYFIYIKLHIRAHYSMYIYVMWTPSSNSLSLFWTAVVFLEPACCFPPFLLPFRLFSFPHSLPLTLPFILPFSFPSCHLRVSLTKGNSRKKDFSSWFSIFRTWIVRNHVFLRVHYIKMSKYKEVS